jgi:superoxide oxidase
MNWKNTNSRYGVAAMALHWLMLLLLIAVYACINLTDLFPKGSDARQALKTWHFMLGLSVLALVLLRLLNRYAGPVPQVIPPLPLWQQRASWLTHALLYAFMVIMPLLGWLVLSASGKVIPFFGFELPALLAPDKDLAEQLREVHETIGTVGYFLIGAHALAAVFHHTIRRDNTLRRMWPSRTPGQS